MSSVNEQLAPPPKPRISPLEFRNTDLVSRLLAATPPYLYNMSLLPNTYFFSEMLRSFVQAKSESTRSSFPHRRTRKRPWTSLKHDFHKSTSPKNDTNNWLEHKTPSDAPLELTTSKLEDNEHKMNTSTQVHQEQVDSIFAPLQQDTNPSNLILPPPPPIWYPPLYPTTAPYGLDPLHFFIDLRVSGHIYDRKNQREETATGTEDMKLRQIASKDMFKQSRHASAFSVPTPRTVSRTPMNLSQCENYTESKNMKFDVKSMGFDKTGNRIGTSYIMSNISSIYRTVTEENIKNEENAHDNETEEERQKRVRDLRALIGLELVVDYMNHAKPQPRRADEKELRDSDAGSPTLEVVALNDDS